MCPTTTELRPELPDLPERIKALPVSDRGYPVPWFVTWLDDAGNPVPRGEGTPEFRVMAPGAIAEAWNGKRCWVCGQTTGRYVAFTLGSMCAINRNNAEPPSHRECAVFAAMACPFLVRPHAKRRPVDDLPGMEGTAPEDRMAGKPILRNPGVAAVWVTERKRIRPYRPHAGGQGVLFHVGEPTEVLWYAEGRPASREEVEASIEGGLPALNAEVEAMPTEAGRKAGFAQLAETVVRAKTLLPAA